MKKIANRQVSKYVILYDSDYSEGAYQFAGFKIYDENDEESKTALIFQCCLIVLNI